jgi:hypothetical protein
MAVNMGVNQWQPERAYGSLQGDSYMASELRKRNYSIVQRNSGKNF